ncbi:PDDEXK-like family protein [Comamonas terrigena]|uniref:PDDEXK-like family protein n=1 Tax=Comamonas terrigena TaxID=32013 RepID=UPI0035E3BEFA
MIWCTARIASALSHALHAGHFSSFLAMSMTDTIAVRALLQHPLLRTFQEQQRQTSAHHNIFQLFGLTLNENAHSAFLAYLLNPMERHGQGTAFLDAWLQWLQPRCSEPLSSHGAHVVAERYAGQWGRIDIVTELGGGTLIAVENKVRAGEQEDQLARYGDWLHAQSESGQRLLVFLTPDGRDGATARAGQSVIRMSYRDLAQVLEQALCVVPDTAHSLRADVGQYIRLCRHLHISLSELPMDTSNTDILKLLDDPQHLQSALALMRNIEVKTQAIRTEFLQHVVSALNEQLLEKFSNENRTWAAMIEPGSTTIFGIGHAQRFTQNYRCVVELLNDSVSVGWRKARGGQICSSPELGQIMCKQLHAVPENWWLCQRTLPTAQWRALQIRAAASELLLQLQADNQATHTMAKQLAAEVWNCFEAFEQQVRELAEFDAHVPAATA